MRLWQLPARALPVTAPAGRRGNRHLLRPPPRRRQRPGPDHDPAGARPAHRKAAGSTCSTATPGSTSRPLARLEALSALPRHRLPAHCPPCAGSASLVPALPTTGLPCAAIPRPSRPARLPLLRAARPLAAPPPTALVRPLASPLLCRRHRRWLGGAAETAQADISAAPEILTAHRRYQRLLARSGDREWAAASIGAAWGITTAPGRKIHTAGRRSAAAGRTEPASSA